jgi:hypothetical protein
MLELEINFDGEEPWYYNVILFHVFYFFQYDMVWFYFQIIIKVINLQI